MVRDYQTEGDDFMASAVEALYEQDPTAEHVGLAQVYATLALAAYTAARLPGREVEDDDD
jgi:hypothetical protein